MCPPPRGRCRRPVQVPRHPARPRQFPRPHPHRPGPERHAQGQHADPRARRRRQGRRDGRASKIMAFRGLERVPVEERRGGRHHRHRRPDRGDRRQHHRRSGGHRAARTRSRSIRRRCRCASRSTTARWPAARAPRCTSRMIRDRLEREAEGNVAIRVTESARQGQLRSRRARRASARRADRDDAPRRLRAVISRPRVLFRDGRERPAHEPYETVVIDVDDEYLGHGRREDGDAQGAR